VQRGSSWIGIKVRLPPITAVIFPPLTLETMSGFLFIALSQAFFATINALVKILQERVAVPVWEIIALRMSVTWLGCILCTSLSFPTTLFTADATGAVDMKWAKIEYPFLGPPGVRLLLCTRGVVGFGGTHALLTHEYHH
jgi:hypothetical protein